ncbi:mechanosensitive ion channel [Pseudomonas capeferrum]|uniref:mechanosensitive ion channel family protein n=1 Tax=Pseudomonas capeferrum TaxID=1495066 RepID=UPI0015E2E03D|nr:mechanosensitive ion channel domain-containing protein [Pseudomonas capeferrum]MBA1200208.1 mechanosensitive ion channel [Pseudomonas capeferrum]
MWLIELSEKSYAVYVLVLLGIATLLSLASYFIVRFIILRLTVKLLFHSGRNHYKKYTDREIRIVKRLSKIAPILVFFILSKSGLALDDAVISAIQTICGALGVINIAIVINDALDAGSEKHLLHKHRSIKGYIQIAKLVVSGVAIILIVATLSNKSPVIILSSLGAAAAVLMLVFQHTLISLVANIQVSSSSVIQIDDWIEIPQLNISGEVIDIALHTITIRNWDNTISRVPTKNFITDSYTNWQPMFDSGGRRIKRSFYVDQSSIAFASRELLQSIESVLYAKDKLHYAMEEMILSENTKQVIFDGLTNLGLFRKHIVAHLKSRKDINQEMYLVVRQLSPTADGLPIEIYCFSKSTNWVDYEEAQSSIFEYIFAVANYFDLVIFQNPSGKDISSLSYIPRTIRTDKKRPA